MKVKKNLLLLAILPAFACEPTPKNAEESAQTNPKNDTLPKQTEVLSAPSDSLPRWYTDFDPEGGKDILIRPRSLDQGPYQADTLLAILNQNSPTPLVFQKISSDTLYLKVENAEYLTQRMGTTGAYHFLAIATYTLTEIEGITYIHFDFPEGDHAVPGARSRTDFAKDFQLSSAELH